MALCLPLAEIAKSHGSTPKNPRCSSLLEVHRSHDQPGHESHEFHEVDEGGHQGASAKPPWRACHGERAGGAPLQTWIRSCPHGKRPRHGCPCAAEEWEELEGNEDWAAALPGFEDSDATARSNLEARLDLEVGQDEYGDGRQLIAAVRWILRSEQHGIYEAWISRDA